MKVAIVIITFNIPPDFFILQMEAIKKYCKDDFVIHIFDNSSNEESAESTRYHAQMANVEYIRTIASTKDSSASHSFAANLSYIKLKEYFEFFIYFDHDLFPLKDFSATKILGEKNVMAGLGQMDGLYLWPGCLFLRKVREIDFSPSRERKLDTGGNLYKIIEDWGRENVVYFNEQYCENPYYHGKYNYFSLINNGMFLHTVGASNWMMLPDNENRTNSLVNILREKIHGDKDDVHNQPAGKDNDVFDTAD